MMDDKEYKLKRDAQLMSFIKGIAELLVPVILILLLMQLD